MKSNLPEDLSRSLSRDLRPLLSDYEKIRYLRKFISATESRLEHLKTNPLGNYEAIGFEEVVLSSTQKELKKLEYRVLMGLIQ